MKTYVLDTNIILEDVANIFKLHNQENRIIIPGPVIDELDATLHPSLQYEIFYLLKEISQSKIF